MFSVLEKFLQRHQIFKDDKSVQQVLVQWSFMPEELATWEDVENLQQQFPDATVWGHPAFLAGGNVSNTDTSEEMAPAVPAKVSTPRRGSRPRKRNVKISGLEWVNV
jgi:hypothetical protein